MKKKTLLKIIFLVFVLAFTFTNCSDDKTITAEHKKAVVDFKVASAAVLETGKSYEVQLVFDKAIDAQSSIVISFQTGTNIAYNANFTTVPEANSNKIKLDIASGQKGASFIFTPVLDNSNVNSGNIIFKIESVTGDLNMSLGNEFTLIYRETAQIVTSTNTLEFPNTYSQSSSVLSYTLNSIGLTENVTISATNNFLVSTDNINYSNELEIDFESINNNPKTIYVKLIPNKGVLGVIQGTILNRSVGVSNVSIAAKGTVLANIGEITLDNTNLVFPLTTEGYVSTSLSYQISGKNLSENILVTASNLFEVSLNNTTFSQSVSVDFNNLNAGNKQKIYVRFLPKTANVPNVTGVITHQSFSANSPELKLSGSIEYDYKLIAYTSFEEPKGYAVKYVDTGNANVSHELTNNAGQAPVQYTSIGGELGFRTFYETTGSVGATDGDDLGVTTKTAIVGAHLNGKQSFYMDDTDGIFKLILDPIDVSKMSQLKISLGYLFNTGFDSDDYIKIYVKNQDGTTVSLLNVNGLDITAQGTGDKKWHLINASLNSLIGSSTINVIFEVKTNSDSEEVYFDDIKVFGVSK